MTQLRKRRQSPRPAGWPEPGDLSDDDVAGLRSETAATFGEEAAATIYDTVSGPLPPEVIEGLRSAWKPGMPTVDDFLASHEELRALVGDKRPTPKSPTDR